MKRRDFLKRTCSAAGLLLAGGFIQRRIQAAQADASFASYCKLPQWWVVMLLSILVAGSSDVPAMGSTRPNVLLIMVDDLNDWVGFLGGHPQVATPNMDRLARRGVVFANAHCSSPLCCPSRAALFSGQQPFHTGVYENGTNIRKLCPDKVLVPQYFAAHGYQTYGTGKLLHHYSAEIYHEYFRPEQRWSPVHRMQLVPQSDTDKTPGGRVANPQRVGYYGPNDTEVILPLNRMPSDRHPDGRVPESFDWGPFDVSDEQMGDGQITAWAVDRLQRASDKPTFRAVGFYRPHIPLWAPRRYFELYPEASTILPDVLANDLDDLSRTARRWALEPVTAGAHRTVVEHGQWRAAVAAYLACVSFVDAQIGRLLDALDKSPAAENTIIILCSDHGWHLGERQHWGKWTGWERSTRVPLVIAPARSDREALQIGATCSQPVGLIDLYPTLIDLCHLPPMKGLDGESLVASLKDPARKTKPELTTFGYENYSIRSRRWRLIHYQDGNEELYDHDTDPHEYCNLISDARYDKQRAWLASFLPESAAAPLKAAAAAKQPQRQEVLLNGEDGIVIDGPYRVVTVAGQTGFQPTSLKTKAWLKTSLHQQPVGSISCWFSSLEDQAFARSAGQHGDAFHYPLVSDVWPPRDVRAMNFGIYWSSGYPQLLAKFAAGSIWPKLDFGLAPYAYAGKATLHRGCWYYVVATWNQPDKAMHLYLNGLEVGHNLRAEGFSEAGDRLYLGNPMMVMRDLVLQKRELSGEQVRQQYEGNRPLGNALADRVVRREHVPQELPKLDVQRDESWKQAYACSFRTADDLDGWHFQTGDQYRQLHKVAITDEGLLVKTPDVIAKESRMYLWSPVAFEGDQWIEFDFRIESPKGVALLVVCASGLQREDFIDEGDLPKTGGMGFILGQTRNYHWEYVRRVEAMRTDVETQYLSKNPWHRQLYYGCIPRFEQDRWYHLRLVKIGPRLHGSIDGRTVFDVKDSSSINNGPVLDFGRIGLRQMYQTTMRYRDFVVYVRSDSKSKVLP